MRETDLSSVRDTEGNFGRAVTLVGALKTALEALTMTSLFGKTILGAALGVGVLAFSAASASAAIVCNGSVCWHAHEHYSYPATAHVIVHPDNWRAGPTIKFHEHEGRGYWNGDRWTQW